MLANNPDAAAGDKLRAAYTAAGDDGLRLVLANALGFRGEPASVELLAQSVCRIQKEPAVTAAEARAGQDWHSRGNRRSRVGT